MEEESWHQMIVMGFSPTEVADGNIILLIKEVEGDIILPIVIGKLEAQAIQIGLTEQQSQLTRPLTFMTWEQTLESSGITVSAVYVIELQENTFLGSIELHNEDREIFEIDSRPSDAIALAVTVGDVPIYCSTQVLDDAGQIVSSSGSGELENPAQADEVDGSADEIDQVLRETDQPASASALANAVEAFQQPSIEHESLEIQKLDAERQMAEVEQNFEEAATLRDKIANLRKATVGGSDAPNK
ncbi:MAG: hypothetical protein CMI53_01825 [Parcubacteria group bacterium]|nr:hypothetical protein [Parcubacteria group bacterium]|tara:strand:+ start:1252 stop:1983 length:732 start_codon:yes stop_codon:yes gene_type:complete